MRLVSFLTTALALSKIRSDLRRREEVLDVISTTCARRWRRSVRRSSCAEPVRRRRLRIGADSEAILRCAARMETMIEDLLDSMRRSSRQLELRLRAGRISARTSRS